MPPGMDRWGGAVAVVTGASSGIGWAVCEALVTAGMRVVGAARRKDRLQALQAHLLRAGAGGRMFLPVMCDVTREDEVRTLMSIAVKTFDGKPVGVLVAAAGARASSGGGLLDGTSKSWVDMISTNVLATGMCCREACTSMKRAGEWGHIVIMGGAVGARRFALLHIVTCANRISICERHPVKARGLCYQRCYTIAIPQTVPIRQRHPLRHECTPHLRDARAPVLVPLSYGEGL